jgi:hypothetical protein
MEYFDQLTTLRIMKETGIIYKRETEYYGSQDVSDLLREALIVEDSPLYLALEGKIKNLIDKQLFYKSL